MKNRAYVGAVLGLAALLASLGGCATAPVQPAPAGQVQTAGGGQATAPAQRPAGPAKPVAQAVGAQCADRQTLADVYHPYRLKVLDPCRTVTGTVVFVRQEPDGDWHLNLRLDSAKQELLDSANYRREHGELVLEIVPADQAACGKVGAPAKVPPTAYRGSSYDYGTCSGLSLTPPAVGTQVAVTGPYVLDSDHGWNEIHPVERIEGVR